MPAHAAKQQVKNALYRSVGAVGVRAGATRRRGDLRVLLYHKVNDVAGNPGSVPVSLFAEHVAALEGMGFRPVGLDDVRAFFREGAPLPPGATLITFDDGYVDNLEHAAPLLARYGYPAVLFVSVGHVGSARPLPHDEALTVSNPLLDWDGLTAIERLGVRVESHGIDHLPLAALPIELARRQIAESRRLLEERLGRRVTAYAFVKGSRTHQGPEHAAALAEAGYELGFTTVTGSVSRGTNPLLLRRYNVEPYPASTLELVLRGACDVMALKDSRPGTAARWAFNAVLRTTSR